MHFGFSLAVVTWVTHMASAAVWDTQVHSQVQNATALVDFQPADAAEFNYSSYSVILWWIPDSARPCNGLSGHVTQEQKVNTTWPMVRERFENVGPAGYYCIRVRPLKVGEGGTCRDGCRSATSDVFFLQGTDDHLGGDDCWKADIILNLWTNQESASVSYNVTSDPGRCLLGTFVVDLWRGVERECDGITGWKIRSKISFGLENSLSFGQLQTGTYCVRVSPKSARRCRVLCLPRYSLVKTLYMNAEPFPILPHPKSSDTVWLVPAILCGVLFSVATLVLGALYWRRKKVCRVMDDLTVKEEKLHVKLNDEGRNCNDSNETVILGVHGSDVARERIRLLAEFLRSDGCETTRVCTLPEEIGSIAFSPEDWVAKKLCSPHVKIVLIESPESVRRQRVRQTLRVDVSVSYPIYYSTEPGLLELCCGDGLLDRVFDSALDMLMATKALDYNSVFVVRFGDIPAGCCLQMVAPWKRFTLPQHLPQLYYHLRDDSHHTLEETNILATWRSWPPYLNLCNSLLNNNI